jgi:hypothetical protein
MSEPHYYYKVVTMDGLTPVMRSCVVGDSDLVVIYRQGERASSPNGPLLVFDTLESAQAFLEYYGSDRREIWTCRAGAPCPVDRLLMNTHGDPDLVRRFWAMDWLGLAPLDIMPAPPGTLAVDWVELVERVQQ